MTVKTYVTGIYQTNCYLVIDDSSKDCAIVDCGDVCNEMDNYIADNNLNVKYIIFTHGHFDHIGGLKHYYDKYRPDVLVHSLDADSLTDERANFTYPAPYNFESVKPTTLLKDNDIIRVGDIKLRVIHTPGHTQGGISLYTEGALFSGDTLFYRSIGRTDFEGGSFAEIEKSIKRLYELPDSTVVYAGHGIKTMLGDEKSENPFVRIR